MWTYPDREIADWDGTLIAKKLKGDGSGITGITGGIGHTIQDEGTPLTARTNLNFIGAGVVVTDNLGTDSSDVTINAGGAETDPKFQAASAAINASMALVTQSALATSAAYVAHAADTTIHFLEANIDHNAITNTHNLTTDIDHTAIQNIGVLTHAAIDAMSAAYSTHVASLAIHFTSNAIYTAINGASSAITTHIANTSDPHGTTLTQTNLVLSSGSIIGDASIASAGYIANIIYGVTSSAITASNYPIGSLLVVYS